MVAPTYPLTMPSTPLVELMDIGLDNNNLESQSGITGKTQTGIQPYVLWDIDFNLPKMSADDARPWVSFFAQLRGKGGTFTFPVPGTETPGSGYTGTIGTVNGAAQTGYTLVTQGWDNNELLVKQGDLCNPGNGELKVARADISSDGFGAATFTFDPPLRNSPANGAALVLSNPTVILASKSNLPKWKVGYPLLTKFNMRCKEKF